MTKIIMIAACATTLSTAALAQISIAPEIGLNLANMHYKVGDEKLDNGLKLGVKAGVNVNINIADRLVLQPGLFYSIKGMKSEENNETHNITLHYAEIPLNIQYMFNDPSEGRFFIGVGPYLGIAFSGKDIYAGVPNGTTTTSGTTDFHFGSGADQDLARIDFGAGVNAGYLLRSGIFFRGMYQMSISNLKPSEMSGDMSIRNSVVTISIGKQFGGTPKSKGPRMHGSIPE